MPANREEIVYLCHYESNPDHPAVRTERHRCRNARLRGRRSAAADPVCRVLRERFEHLARGKRHGEGRRDPGPRSRRGDRRRRPRRSRHAASRHDRHRGPLYGLRALRVLPERPFQRLRVQRDAGRPAGRRHAGILRGPLAESHCNRGTCRPRLRPGRAPERGLPRREPRPGHGKGRRGRLRLRDDRHGRHHRRFAPRGDGGRDGH